MEKNSLNLLGQELLKMATLDLVITEIKHL